MDRLYTLIERLQHSLHWTLQPTHLFVGAFGLVGYRLIYSFYYSPLRHIPGSPWARFSNLHYFYRGTTRCINDTMVDDCEKFGNLYVVEPRKVAVCHPDDCRLVLSSYAFVKDNLYSEVDFLEPSIFSTSDPELNKQRRRQIGPALSMAGLQKMEPNILAAGPQQLMAKWDQQIDLSPNSSARINYFIDLSLMSFDIISSLGFGKQHRSLTTGDRTTANWIKKTFVLMVMQMVVPATKRWPLKGVVDRWLRRDVDDFFAFAYRAIRDRKLEMAKGFRHNDILQNFIEAEDPESKIKMTPSQMITETITVLLGGADTSSTALSWTLHLLMLYPDKYKRVVEEVRSNFSKDQLITYEMAKQHLPYMEACLLESLRLCPVSTNLPRIVPKGGITLRGHYIPEGYAVTVSTAAANKNQECWDSPHQFVPERFLDNEALRKNLLTMSAGVRICPGRHLAMVEMLTTMGNMLNRYDFELPKDAQYRPERLDGRGVPEIMPRTSYVAMVPKHPDQHCDIFISKRI